jgi:hypothetical protein
VIEAFSARIGGRVLFEGSPSPAPSATISVFSAGKTVLLAQVTSSPTSGSFFVDALDGGTYDLVIGATGFLEQRVTGVVVEDEGTTVIGDVTLPEGCVSAFTVIRVVGDFNNWDTAAPSMTQVSPCVWADTLAVGESGLCTYIKFRTAEDWGPNDYGGCAPESPACPGTIPLAGTVCAGSGGSEPAALGKLQFPAAGMYEFRLDERSLSYTITAIP